MANAEERLFGHPVIEALVLAILVGMIIRTVWAPSGSATQRIKAGVDFTAKQVLEVAVCLLGVSVDLPQLLKRGPALALGIVLIVILGLTLSYLIGRAFGLPHKLAVLVACGNSICGNSAIAAVAPVIEAEAEHIASSIAFTAILGVVVVIGLPFLVHPLGLSFYQYGVLAGLTVYAVPQVLAAAFPVSVLSGQVGTLVKLMRVLMLGPVVLFFAVRHRATAHTAITGHSNKTRGVSITRLVPWFIIGFLMLAALRSSGIIPLAAATPTWKVSGWLTIAAMAALGLGVDLNALKSVGRSVVMTVTCSLAVLVVMAIGLIHILKIQ
jgi:uncharacterized integral membrane protein (TIGR00698 family)